MGYSMRFIKNKSTEGSSLYLPLLKLFKNQWVPMLIGTTLSTLAMLASIALMALSGWFISATGYIATTTYVIAQHFNYFYPAAGVRLFSMLRIITRYGERVVSHEATFRILTDIRLWVYQKLIPLTPQHLVKYHSGDLLTRLINDVNTLDHFYIHILSPTIVLIFTLLITSIFFSFFSIQLAIVIALCVFISGFIIPIITEKISNNSAIALTQKSAQLKTLITEHLQTSAELKIFSENKAHTNNINQLNAKLIRCQKSMSYYSGFGQCLMTLVFGITLTLATWITTGLFNNGELNGSVIALIALAIIALFEAIMPMPTAYQYLGKISASAKRLFEITNQQSDIKFFQTTAISLPKTASINFQDVTFAYKNKHYILENFNLSIQANEKIAIVGKTGAGKSTIVNLLARFWEPQQGKILIAGHNIKQLSESQLRQTMSILSQNDHIFNSSIADNLRIADPKASDHKLYQALEKVDLAEFVKQLPDKLDTWSGEYGQHLSKGQQRRLSLARIFLTNTPIIILDEPTSGVDSITEEKISHTLKALMQNRTTVLITHNPLLLDKVDRVVRLNALSSKLTV